MVLLGAIVSVAAIVSLAAMVSPAAGAACEAAVVFLVVVAAPVRRGRWR